MKKLTAEDLFNLKHGDKVYRHSGTEFRRLYFVGFMPRTDSYLIFCDGEYLTHLYIGADGTFRSDWYDGDTYDTKFVGELKIKSYESMIESVKKVYLED